MALAQKHFETWLKSYGAACEAKDAGRFGALFEDDAILYVTPFADPRKGRDAIKAGFSELLGGQREIDFGARVLYVEAQLGAAHWSCSFTRGSGKRVHIDGVLVVSFSESGKALSLRQWWHTDE